MGPETLTVAGLLATLGLLLCSAFFSSSETAMFSLPQEWIDRQAGTSDRRARALKELRDDPHRLLVTILVGNNVVNVAISSILTVVIATYLTAGLAVLVTTVLTSFVVLIFGEIVPKAYGLGNARSWALTVAPPIRLVERAFSPVIVFFDGITRRINARISAANAIERPYLE